MRTQWLSLACVVPLLCTLSASAAIVYTDIPDVTLEGEAVWNPNTFQFDIVADEQSFDLNSDGVADLRIAHWPELSAGNPVYGVSYAYGSVTWPASIMNFPPFQWPDVIGPAVSFANSVLLANAFSMPFSESAGVRVSAADGNHFGWVHITTSSDMRAKPTIHGYAIESAANRPIYAGARLSGDTNLDDAVDFSDLLRLAQSYGAISGQTWFNGDSDWNGRVDFDDLLLLAQSYGVGATSDVNAGTFPADWATAQSLIPEPAMLVSIGLCRTMLRRRARAL